VLQEVGLEILDWIIGEGEQVFRTALYEITDKYNEYKKLLILGLEELVIDFDSIPHIPAGLTIAPDNDQVKTRVRGKRKMSGIRVVLHLDDIQKNGKRVKGYDLKWKLEGQEVFGAQLLDLYCKHTDLIPEDWKTKSLIFFWGTIYRDDLGLLYVRYLYWSRKKESWVSDYYCFDNDRFDDCPAVVSVGTQS
jgi:hypothetical protein